MYILSHLYIRFILSQVFHAVNGLSLVQTFISGLPTLAPSGLGNAGSS